MNGTDRHPFGTSYRQILIAANEQLDECRRSHIGGLIVCDNIEHTNAIGCFKTWTNEDSIVMHTESGNSKRAIEGFKDAKKKKNKMAYFCRTNI